jgi:hypothetical protein
LCHLANSNLNVSQSRISRLTLPPRTIHGLFQPVLA